MSERLSAAIEEIVAQIEAKEAELVPLKVTVNHLCQTIGEAPRYAIDGTGAAPGLPKRNVLSWKIDQFHNRPLAQCVTEYLEAREKAGLEKPATVDDIYDALTKGGYKFEGTSGSEENTKRAIKISLTKNTAQFSKVGENLFGLKRWYGSRAPSRRPSNGSKTTEGDEAGNEAAADSPPEETKTPE